MPEPTPAVLQEALNDPVKFTSLCWPDIKLLMKSKKRFCIAYASNIETFVHAANEVGKDFIAGLACVWFFASRTPCRIVTSSSGETQLKSILWGEINERPANQPI